jgi:hypothetical protein
MTKQKQISVNLDVQMNPNPKLLATYKDANAEEMFKGNRYSIPEYKNEERIFVASRSSKAPIKHNLFSCYRKKVGSKEYFFAFDLMTTKDYFKNKIDHTRLIGRFEMPVIVSNYSISPSTIRSDTAMIEPVQSPPTIESTHEEYEWEFSAIVPQLKKWWESGVIPQTANFYVVIGNDKYGRYTFEEFVNLDISDLELLGKFGNRVRGVWKPGEPMTEKLETLREQLKQELRQPPLTK